MKVVVRGNKMSKQCRLDQATLVVDFPLAHAKRQGGLKKWKATTPRLAEICVQTVLYLISVDNPRFILFSDEGQTGQNVIILY